jgi:DNA-binding NarL/FixJ family response regulator
MAGRNSGPDRRRAIPRPCGCVRGAGVPRCAACLARPLQVAVVAGTDFPNGASPRSIREQARCWTWHFFASDGHALDKVVRASPDVLVLSASPPGACSLQCPSQLEGHLPELRVLMLANAPEKPAILRAIQDGATGFLELPLSPVEVACGVRDLAKGQTVLCAMAQAAMVEFFQGVGRASPKRKLGNAEHLIMKPLLLGKTNEEIATVRGLEVNTVCAHLKNIYKKLGVHSRNDARSKYLRLYGGALPLN